MIAKYNNISLLVGIPGLIINFIGGATGRLPIAILGALLLMVGLTFYAIAKGRSPFWGLCGLLSLIGLIILALLEDRAPSGKIRGKKGPANPYPTRRPAPPPVDL